MSENNAKMFVGGLHINTTTESLRAHFERFGPVTECMVIYDPMGRSRCFGFVTMAHPAAVDTILGQTHILDSKQIDPKRSTISPPQRGSSGAPRAAGGAGHRGSYGQAGSSDSLNGREDLRVFVGGFAPDTSEDELRAAAQRFGDVRSVVIMRDRVSGAPRCYGFVAFVTRDAMLAACDARELVVRGRTVEIRQMRPKPRPAAQPGQLQSTTYGAGYSAMQPADVQAAWAEYYRQNPGYYEAMMAAAYGAAAAGYYAPYYYGVAGSARGGTEAVHDPSSLSAGSAGAVGGSERVGTTPSGPDSMAGSTGGRPENASAAASGSVGTSVGNVSDEYDPADFIEGMVHQRREREVNIRNDGRRDNGHRDNDALPSRHGRDRHEHGSSRASYPRREESPDRKSHWSSYLGTQRRDLF